MDVAQRNDSQLSIGGDIFLNDHFVWPRPPRQLGTFQMGTQSIQIEILLSGQEYHVIGHRPTLKWLYFRLYPSVHRWCGWGR